MDNQPKKSMHISSRFRSFSYAFSGLQSLLKHEPNARLHLIATIAAIAAGFIRHISPMQWVAIIIAIGLVWITEALNTCIEKLCDLWTGTRFHPTIKVIKDISAAAVLIAAMVSLGIAACVFLFS